MFVLGENIAVKQPSHHITIATKGIVTAVVEGDAVTGEDYAAIVQRLPDGISITSSKINFPKPTDDEKNCTVTIEYTSTTTLREDTIPQGPVPRRLPGQEENGGILLCGNTKEDQSSESIH